jgi:cyclase
VEIFMKKIVIAVFFLFALWGGDQSSGAPLRFEKVSDHCYYLQLKGSGDNVAAVITDEGILVVDPPAEPDLTPTVAALKRVSPKPVRWVVFSNPRSARSAGGQFFAEQGAVLLGGAKLRALSNSPSATEARGEGGDLSSFPWLIFENQIHLFPSNVEIRIMALQHKAITGGDVIVHIPAEKILLAGRVYELARYPDIDTSLQGDADEWVDGLKQVVDSIPVLKPAIPQAKVDPKTEPEKTLEEMIAVISARGDISNLQNMKDLLSASQKLRAELAKTVKAGRSCENFINSARVEGYRLYENFSAYAMQLCESLTH